MSVILCLGIKKFKSRKYDDWCILSETFREIFQRTLYKLRNRTGYNMHVGFISSDDATDTGIKKIDDEQRSELEIWRLA
jgi:hypothetical protein